MIEKLMNPELSYGEPEYSRIAPQITHLREKLETQLNDEGRGQLEQLYEVYLHQNNIALADAFRDGFCTAVSLVMEIWKYSGKNSFSPDVPPKQ